MPPEQRSLAGGRTAGFLYAMLVATSLALLAKVWWGSRRLSLLRPCFLLFGDSLTQHAFHPTRHGWGAALQHEYAGKVDVLNRGLSGYTTRWGRAVVEEVCDVPQPVLLAVVLWGANDHVDADSRPQYHVPLEEFRRNLHAIVLALRRRRSGRPPPKVVVVTPPPSARPDRQLPNCLAYARACREVVADLKDDRVSLLDLHHAMLEQPWRDLLV
eukprot:EG_transcript_28290